jgi:serine/threonine protein kinase
MAARSADIRTSEREYFYYASALDLGQLADRIDLASQATQLPRLEAVRWSKGKCRFFASFLRGFILHTFDRNQGSVIRSERKTNSMMQQPTDHSLDPDTAVSISVGRILRDRYVIQERLGSDGRGTVFKALDRYRSSFPDDQQHVALKAVHSGRDGSEHAVQELHRELRCGQLLSHRNIVNVFELDRDADVVFFTMEFLDGEFLIDLIERLRPATMQRLQAWQIIRQLGAGLEHAHERDIVHGDLNPRNILVTRDGEVRILGFGAAYTTPAYASCELLEGRAADPRNDLYALACICYELLSGAHPFAGRRATLARDFGVKATRPAGLTGRQWRTLQTGLSWHRSHRSMSVHAWIQNLTNGIAEKHSKTPLLQLKAARPAKLPLHSRAAAVIALLLITGMGIAQLRAISERKTSDSVAMQAAPNSLDAQAPEATVAPEATQQAEAPVMDARPEIAKDAMDGMTQRNPSVQQAPLTISVDGYQVSSGHHFVEIRVHRNQLQNASFAWWTEPATARQDVDYVHQAKAIQTFPSDRRSTRLYVKLLPDSERSQRDYFYLAIAQPGRGHTSPNVTRVQIWLPTPRDQLQARR